MDQEEDIVNMVRKLDKKAEVPRSIIQSDDHPRPLPLISISDECAVLLESMKGLVRKEGSCEFS